MSYAVRALIGWFRYGRGGFPVDVALNVRTFVIAGAMARLAGFLRTRFAGQRGITRGNYQNGR